MTTEIGYFTPRQAERVWRNALAFEKTLQGTRVPEQQFLSAPISFVNRSGHTVPPYGCMQIIDTEEINGRNYLQVARPFDYSGVFGPFLLNNDREVADDDFGTAQSGPVFRALSDGSTLGIGTRIGPLADSFEVGKGCLFTNLGPDDIEPDVIRVMRCETQLRAVAGAGGIAANSSGTVTAKVPTSTGWAAGSVTYTAYNISATAISNNANVLIFPVDARWVAVEVC